ncbi:MAG: fimbrillin family protein [Muribaculaceae bacterium]|nr:fimbrillin family protein [Muribaculaceae bacterium]
MYAKLTYLLTFLACATCLLSSCSSDTPDVPAAGKGSEVSFDVSDITRASVTTSFNQFAVYGDRKSSESPESDQTVIFNKTEVNYKDGGWSYEGVQYWIPKNEHSFVAISPVSALETSGNPQYSNSRLSFTYIIPTTENKVSAHSDVADILAATHRRLHNDGDTNTTTTFRFAHVMSLINLAPALDDNVMNPDEYIQIHKMELSGFKTKADFSIVPAQRQSASPTDDRVIEITGQERDGTLTIDFATPVKVANDRKNVSLFDANNAIIMLPQNFSADSEAKIIIHYTANNDESMKQGTLPLKNQKWESGKSYTYRFTISRTGLRPDETTISNWDVLNVGNIDAH